MRELINFIRDFLRDSTEIATYCQNMYGKKHNVYIGMNPQDPPVDEPSLTLVGIKTQRAGTRAKLSFTIGICVKKKDQSDHKEGEIDAKSYEGFIEAEELRELAEAALIKSKKFLKPEFDSESLPNEIFPVFTTATTMSIEVVISSRS